MLAGYLSAPVIARERDQCLGLAQAHLPPNGYVLRADIYWIPVEGECTREKNSSPHACCHLHAAKIPGTGSFLNGQLVATGDLNNDVSNDLAGVFADGQIWYVYDKVTWDSTQIPGVLSSLTPGKYIP